MFEGRVQGAIFAVVLVMLSIAISIFSCSTESVLGVVNGGIFGLVTHFVFSIPYSAVCVGWVPEVIGVVASSVLQALALVCLVQVALG